MNNPLIMHVNCVEQGQSILEMCQCAVRWGFAGIEFRRKRGQVTETPEEYLETIARAVDQTHLPYVLFGGPGPDLMQADAGKRRQAVDECIHFYRAAARLFRLTVCNTMTGPIKRPDAGYLEFDKNGSACATPEQWDQAVEGFKSLGDLATELGFRFAFETHNCYLHDLPQPTRTLVERIGKPSVGINLDHGNIVLHPQAVSLAEAIKVCGPHLYEVHLKNMYMLSTPLPGNYIACPLADGIINHRAYLRHLKALHYEGPICIETPREGDREWYARQDLAYWRTLLVEEAF